MPVTLFVPWSCHDLDFSDLESAEATIAQGVREVSDPIDRLPAGRREELQRSLEAVASAEREGQAAAQMFLPWT